MRSFFPGLLMCHLWAIVGLLSPLDATASQLGNRLAHLADYVDPYYVGRDVPRLVTPQWVGQEGVEAVIVLAIDDMSDVQRYETFLRPILQRLQQIDGRAPVSMMTTRVDPRLPQLQRWLEEGLSIEAHTLDHPCPCLQGGSLAKAKATYDQCVDLLATIPNSRPVAFRMPCCDSMNSVSPRFFAEVLHRITPAGRFLTIDSSVFQVFTAADPVLPSELTRDPDGRDRFKKYLPADRLMVNYVENYPYPYVIGRLCWEFPCLMPSDWDAQHRNGKKSPLTLRDLKAAVDATVIKRGVFSLCFHPHGWIDNRQVVELIDYAVEHYGQRVKFLTFREVQERLDTHLLGGHPLRAADGQDNGVRLLDVNHDGYMDVVVGNATTRQTRVWDPETSRWTAGTFPVSLVGDSDQGGRAATGVCFGVLNRDGRASVLVNNERDAGVWHFAGAEWVKDPHGLRGLQADGPIFTAASGRERGVCLRDLDLDGVCELIVGNPRQQGVFGYGQRGWRPLPFRLPEGAALVDAAGRDAGLRLVDVDEDGHDDVVFSNAQRYRVDRFVSLASGWSDNLLAGRRGASDRGSQQNELPMIVKGDGTNNGVWFSHGHMWVQNEDTGGELPEHVRSHRWTDGFPGQ
jgi:hypothetical protein